MYFNYNIPQDNNLIVTSNNLYFTKQQETVLKELKKQKKSILEALNQEKNNNFLNFINLKNSQKFPINKKKLFMLNNIINFDKSIINIYVSEYNNFIKYMSYLKSINAFKNITVSDFLKLKCLINCSYICINKILKIKSDSTKNIHLITEANSDYALEKIENKINEKRNYLLKKISY